MDQLFPLFFLLRFFKADHYVQKLVSETHDRDCKVDDHGFAHDFRGVLGVAEFGGEVKFEILTVVDKIIRKLDVLLSSSINDVFL